MHQKSKKRIRARRTNGKRLQKSRLRLAIDLPQYKLETLVPVTEVLCPVCLEEGNIIHCVYLAGWDLFQGARCI